MSLAIFSCSKDEQSQQKQSAFTENRIPCDCLISNHECKQDPNFPGCCGGVITLSVKEGPGCTKANFGIKRTDRPDGEIWTPTYTSGGTNIYHYDHCDNYPPVTLTLFYNGHECNVPFSLDCRNCQ